MSRSAQFEVEPPGRQARGIRIPLSDLLTGASALELGYGVGTANLRHFEQVPGLKVVKRRAVCSHGVTS